MVIAGTKYFNYRKRSPHATSALTVRRRTASGSGNDIG